VPSLRLRPSGWPESSVANPRGAGAHHRLSAQPPTPSASHGSAATLPLCWRFLSCPNWPARSGPSWSVNGGRRARRETCVLSRPSASTYPTVPGRAHRRGLGGLNPARTATCRRCNLPPGVRPSSSPRQAFSPATSVPGAGARQAGEVPTAINRLVPGEPAVVIRRPTETCGPGRDGGVGRRWSRIGFGGWRVGSSSRTRQNRRTRGPRRSSGHTDRRRLIPRADALLESPRRRPVLRSRWVGSRTRAGSPGSAPPTQQPPPMPQTKLKSLASPELAPSPSTRSISPGPETSR